MLPIKFSINRLFGSYMFIMFLGFMFLSCDTNEKETAKSSGSAENKIQQVGVIHPDIRDFNSNVSITGTAMPYQMIQLQAMENGYIKSMYRDIGDEVAKGGLIAQLSNPILSSQYAESKASTNKMAAMTKKYEAEKTNWEAISSSKKAIFDRLNNTFEKAPNIVLASDVDRARGEYESAQANLSAASSSISAARAQHDAAKSVEQAFARRVGMLRIKAPFSGVITKRHMDVGTAVQSALGSSGSEPIVDMQDLSKIRLTLHVPESDATTLKVDSEVKISFPELVGEDITAKISRTSNTLDAASKTMQVEIDLDNGDKKIKPGMYAKVELNAKNRAGVLSLPVAARKLINDVPYILAVVDNKVQPIKLKQGLSGRDFFEVLNPEITKQTQVIIQGKNLVREGQEVQTSTLNK